MPAMVIKAAITPAHVERNMGSSQAGCPRAERRSWRDARAVTIVTPEAREKFSSRRNGARIATFFRRESEIPPIH
jgi:hypothetical protein